jgi:hypothetical protein
VSERRLWRPLPIAITLALLLFYGALVLAGARAADGNRRAVTLLSLGSEASSRSGDVASDGDALVVSADAGSGAATWDQYSYEVTHLANRARSCEMSVALVGLALTSPSKLGSAEILVNGNGVKRISFATASRAFYPLAGRRFVPTDVDPRLIELVPLDPEYGFVVPIPSSYCSANSLKVGIRVTGATWTISHAGIILAYTPAPMTLSSRWFTVFFGGILLVALIACLWLVLTRMATVGTVPLAATTCLLLFSPLAYDQWDFRLWLSFSEVVTFGAGDPAYLWKGSPLWAFVPSLFSTITDALYVLTGYGSEAVTAILLKIAMGLAYVFSAYQIALRAPLRLRRTYALFALLLPIGLYELGAGYREVLASAIVIASLVAASREKLLLSAMLAAVAASIAEVLTPMILFPATFAMTAPESLQKRLRTAATVAAVGIGIVVAQWIMLLPRDAAATAFGYRFGAAHFGGASWAGALRGLGSLPAWLPAGSPLFGAIVFGVLALGPAAHFVRVIRGRSSEPRTQSFDEIVAGYVALVGAFVLAFRGADPNLWYPVTIVTLWYFARAKPLNPFPLLLGMLQGLGFYSTVGLGEFVNQTFFWPVDHGLLGALSALSNVIDLMVDALLIAFILTVSRRSELPLFSLRSPQFVILFASAVTATATGEYGLDGIVCAAAVVCFVATFERFISSSGQRWIGGPMPLLQGAGIIAFIAAGAYFGPRSGVAVICVSTACLLASLCRIGLCDVVLGVGAIAVVAVQPGSGVVSHFGSIALIASVLVVINEVVRETGRSIARIR